MKLGWGSLEHERGERDEAYAINRFIAVPLPFNIKPTRTSLNARARRASLSYFSYTTGTSNMSDERTRLVTDTKTANPDKPATGDSCGGHHGVGVGRTWANFPLGLETCNACETSHGDEVEEYLGGSEDNHGFGNDHLRKRKH
jgi:hypothetical protein